MMRIRINKNATGLVSYFTNSLSKDDYFFEEDKAVSGYWHGKLVEVFKLGLRVSKKDFSAFAHNIHPRTGERLSIRETENRRTSIEYVFSAPKSVSVVMALTGDREILNAHRRAVKKAMQAIERDMYTQFRIDGKNTYQPTGNILYARFDHFTARPTKELNSSHARYSADPLLHSHCIVPNITAYNGRFRALEGSVIHRMAGYYEATYHSHLSKSLQEIGYDIVRTKDRYEIKGISRRVIEKFSNRTMEIEKLAKKLGLTDAKKKSELGAKTRLNKTKLKPDVNLEKIWLARLTEKELQAIKTAKGVPKPAAKALLSRQAVDRALEHCLERNSAVPEKKLVAHALTLGYGALTPEAVQEELKSRENILYAKDGYLNYLTTVEMVRAENRMIEFAGRGKNTIFPIHQNYRVRREFLNDQQRKAIQRILRSTDRVTVLSGAAGVGKSTLLIEVKDAAEQKGKRIVAIAPSSGASRMVLRQKGFKEADTIAKFLYSRELQKQAKDQIILVDEASLVGVKTMNRIFSTAQKLKARVILSGDIRQHSSPEHGDALRLLQQKAQLEIARVDQNLRQAGNPVYKEAIDMLAAGRTRQGFVKLDLMNAVIEIEDTAERHQQIAKDYVRSLDRKRSALVISPTHAEGRVITQAIREEMKARGRIGFQERSFTIQRNLSLTAAQKKDPAMYEPGMIVQFHQNVKGGYKAGRKYEVISDKGQTVHIALQGERAQPLPLKEPQHFQVFLRDELPIAKGDVIRITNNGKSFEKYRLHNGQVFTVEDFTKLGDIRLSNGKTLPKDFANFQYGYVQTSHAAQGKDCKDVLIAQSAMSFGAANDKQFYVSASRAKDTIKIYTDDKDTLRKAISRSGDRISARDIADRQTGIRRKRLRYYQHMTKKLIKDDRTKQGYQEPLYRPVSNRD